ncbi:beta-galactosidase [Cohnella soli]|uniref:Beta-galactosidase n=1 Tax=Cohnella soli TaxID=425005 RepID=A0ABW0I042_9BACL
MTLPISFWVSPPKDQVSIARFEEIRNAGFTHINDFNDWQGDVGSVRLSMDYSFQCGLKYMVNDTRVTNLQDFSLLADYIREFSDHPAYLGHYLCDEPGVSQFDRLGHIAAAYYALLPGGMAYINLYPTYASFQQLGATYPEYLKQFCDKVPQSILSYDHYPLKISTQADEAVITADYFNNLRLVRSKALEIGLPFWVFIQTLAIASSLRDPNAEEMLWQVNMSLAYGAKGLQYFTYWTPPDAHSESFGEAMIDREGRRTRRYEEVRQINLQLKELGNVFMACKSIDVLHFEGEAPAGTWYDRSPFEEMEGGAVVIGGLEDPAGHVKWFIVNASFRDETILRLKADERRPFHLFIWRQGIRQPLPLKEDGAWISITLSPGEGQLLEWL